MIRYILKCADGHPFESWFQSAASFEDLKRLRHLSCPECGSSDILKSLMAPPVSTSRRKTETAQDHTLPSSETVQEEATSNASVSAPKNAQTTASPLSEPSTPASTTAPQQQVTPSNQEREASIAKVRHHVEKHSDYVGDDFTKQARAMNDGEAPIRSIYGEANLEDAKALIAEGVPVIPLPFAPKRKLN